MTSQLNVALSFMLSGSSMCFVYICDIISMGVSTTRQGQMSGRMVQELSVRTVPTRCVVIITMVTVTFLLTHPSSRVPP